MNKPVFIGFYYLLFSTMRLYGFLAFVFTGRLLCPRGRHKPHRLSTNRLFWTSGQILRASYEAGQDKHGCPNGVQRRQTRAGVPKKQFSASKKKKMRRRHFRVLSDFSLFIGLSAFTDFIQV
jgi:hypothetical protein